MIELIILLIVIGVFTLGLYTLKSHEDTTVGKVREAVSEASYDAAIGIAKLVEPAQKKQLRVAKEQLALRNGVFFRARTFDSAAYLLEVDDKFRKCLDTLELTEESYKELSKMMFYIGKIENDSKKDYREKFLNEWINDNSVKPYVLELKRALEYFSIPEQEWIDYGGTVLLMHNINKYPLIEEFGYKL